MYEVPDCDAVLTDRVEDTTDYAEVADIVALAATERNYRTLPGARNRALAGLSMGSFHTRNGLFTNPTDFSYYTKRASLAAILGAATLYWLDDRSPDFADTDAFVERRLGDLYRITGIGRRLVAASDAMPNPFRLFRPSR